MVTENNNLNDIKDGHNENQEPGQQTAQPDGQEKHFNGENQNVISVSGLYKDWFLDYASYVILERAVPHIKDGLKPVQRRILHAMYRLEDGRYNKVANIIGYTMQYHPHGDASIYEAIVQLGQKDLLIDTQGNWGNIYTGDSAAAARYIEARLSKFALDVLFSPKVTEWKLSYDGRNKEPVHLPAKFPLLLVMGVEGIAVGLASKILPHNFNEVIDAAIAYLKNQDFELYPDFPTGGMIDVSRYNEGLRGGKVRVRARIVKEDKKQLVITDIPFGKTTGSLIDSIISANEKGKIKIKKIEDKTADKVRIVIHLPNDADPDKTIDALYAFTDCEISISPNATVIDDDKPKFMSVKEILRRSVDNTLQVLKKELEIKLGELEEAWHFASLEKIFIENRIYLLIEDCETWECIIETIDKALDPFKPKLKREVTYDDIVRLTEIKIKRISKYDAKKAEEHILDIEEKIKNVKYDLEHIVDFTINHYQRLKDKYGKGRERKTEIRNFEEIEATHVVAATRKLYVDWKEGFAGYELKNADFVSSCSDIDNVLVVRKDGTYFVTKVQPKFYIGKNVIHVGIVKKGDKSTVYNVAYRDGKTGYTYVKRFKLGGVTRDREYNLTQGNPHSAILYFSATKGEAEVIHVKLKPKPRLKKKEFDFDFGDLPLRNRNAQGVILTRHAIHKIKLKNKGQQTIGVKLWFDSTVNRLKNVEADIYLGEFTDDDRILVITKRGTYYLAPPDLNHHFPDDISHIEKYDPKKVYNVVYYNAEQGYFYLKRFTFEPSDSEVSFIGDHANSFVFGMEPGEKVLIKIIFGGKDKNREPEIIDAGEFIKVKSLAARGKRLTTKKVAKVEFIVPEEPVENGEQEEKVKEQSLFEDTAAQGGQEQADSASDSEDIEFEVKLPDGSEMKLDE